MPQTAAPLVLADEERDQLGRRGAAGDELPVLPMMPAIQEWPARHPRFCLHFTPTGASWINQPGEQWFGYLTGQMLRRGYIARISDAGRWR